MSVKDELIERRLRKLCDDCIMAPQNFNADPKPCCAQCKLKHDAANHINYLAKMLDREAEMYMAAAQLCTEHEATMRSNRVTIESLVDECDRLKLYERAIESMASQMIHPKMTAEEMAKMQLGET